MFHLPDGGVAILDLVTALGVRQAVAPKLGPFLTVWVGNWVRKSCSSVCACVEGGTHNLVSHYIIVINAYRVLMFIIIGVYRIT